MSHGTNVCEHHLKRDVAGKVGASLRERKAVDVSVPQVLGSEPNAFVETVAEHQIRRGGEDRLQMIIIITLALAIALACMPQGPVQAADAATEV